MNILTSILLVLFYLSFPAVIIYLSSKFSAIKKIGLVMVAYLVGMALAVSGLLPENAPKIQSTLTDIAVPLALPLLLFSLNVRDWLKLAGKTFLSMILGIVSLTIVVVTGHYFLSQYIPDAWKISGMMMGVYTGGTPNLVSIKTALNVDNNAYIVTHTLDTIFSLIYIVFLVSIAQRVFGVILPRYKFASQATETNEIPENDIENFDGLFSAGNFTPLLKALGLSVLILGIGGAVSIMLPSDISTMVAILLITTLGIILSLFPAINRIKKTFQLGMYFILIFCLVVASMINMDNLLATSWAMVVYIFAGIFGTLFLHALLSAIFKIDTDTTIITTTALICSPPFVPVVAAGIKNKEVIISGLTVGIIGYAVGNYLGIATAFLLK